MAKFQVSLAQVIEAETVDEAVKSFRESVKDEEATPQADFDVEEVEEEEESSSED